MGSSRAVFLLTVLALLATSLQFSMVSVALPNIIEDFDTNLTWAGWIVTSFLLAQAISMPVSGKLSDSVGRKTVFVGGALVFGLASLACALSPSIFVLVLARGLQGLASGSILPSAYGLVGDAFLENKERYLGLLSATFPMGSVVGPSISGVIVEQIGWRWTFAFTVPPIILVIIAALALLRSKGVRNDGAIDFVGAGLLATIVAAFILGLNELAQDDPSEEQLAAAFAVGVAILPIFLVHESRVSDPVVDVHLVGKGTLGLMNAFHFSYGIGLLGAFFFIPLYAQSVYSATSSESGLLLAPRSVIMIAGSIVGAMVIRATGYRKPIVAGLLLLAISLFALSLAPHDLNVGEFAIPDFGVLVAIVIIGGLGIGIAAPSANNAALQMAPDQIATVIGLRGMFRFIGGVFGTTLIVLLTSRSDSTAEGLQLSFAVIGATTALTTLMMFWLKTSPVLTDETTSESLSQRTARIKTRTEG